MCLSAGELISAIYFLQLSASGPKSVRTAQFISIEADRVLCGGAAEFSGTRAPVTEMKCDHSVRLPRHDPNGRADRVICKGDLNHRRDVHSVLAAPESGLYHKSKRIRCSGTDDCRVVPCKFGEWFRQFLQPAVVGETPVVN